MTPKIILEDFELLKCKLSSLFASGDSGEGVSVLTLD